MALTDREKAALLDRVDLFQGLGGVPLSAVAEHAVETDVPAGHLIVRQGDPGTGFFLVVQGGVRIVRDGQTIETLGPGGFFGELSLIDGGPRLANAIATEPTTCLAIASWEFDRLLDEQPELARGVLNAVVRRLRATAGMAHR